MNYYVYKITNLLTNQYYIGKRQCECSIDEDKYMGSGVEIKEQIKNHGIDNFKKEIIAICQNEQELYLIEGLFIRYNKENSFCINIQNGKKQDPYKRIQEYKIKIKNQQKQIDSLLIENKNLLYKKTQEKYIKKNTLSKLLKTL